MSHRQEIESFDQPRIDMIERAIERAWEVVSHVDVIESEEDARRLIAQCVLHQMQVGEENPVRIVNKSILDFRRRRALNVVRERQSRVQAR
jgi:hypothetical protein